MKKILIIGSQGYLGSRLTDFLKERGYNCTGSDVGFFQYGVLYHPQPVRNLGKAAQNLGAEDIKGYDVVIQLAGISNDPFGNLDPAQIYDPTREYALHIAKLCKKLGVRYLFPSSCSVYGIGEGFLNEDGPTNPQTGYSLNKLQIEQDLAKIAGPNFSPIALRLATVFGSSPRIRFDLVINMLCGMSVTQKKIILNSNGLAWRPHLYIDDVCEAFRCCIEWDYNLGELLILNLGRNENNWRIIDVANFISNLVEDCKIEYISDKNINKNELFADRKIISGKDKRSYQVKFDKILNSLPNFQSNWTVEEGITKLISELKRWKLDENKFKQREFYRLQQLEYLYKTKQI